MNRWLQTASAAALALACSPAIAQSVGSQATATTPQPDAGTTQDRDVPSADIVVTARKTAERLIDTPQSVTALSSADLGRLNATQFRDFANTVPALSFTTNGAGQSQITLRGVTSGSDISPTVGVYVDDVPYGGSTSFSGAAGLGLDVGLFDIQRVEVLRGPQGTLYGSSTMGGLLKYVTKVPTTDRLSGAAEAGISDTRGGAIGYNGSAAVNLPIATDKAAIRVSGFYSRDGGVYDNVTLGDKNADRSKVYGGRADLLLTPIDRLSIRVTGYLQNIDRQGEANADYTSAGKPVAGTYDQRRLYAEPFTQRFRLISGTINYDFGPAALTSVSSYQTADSHFFDDLSALYVPLLGRAFGVAKSALDKRLTTDKFTQEVRLASSGEPRFGWLIGGFYTHEKSDNYQNVLAATASGAALPVVLANVHIPSVYEEVAGFANLTWRITDKFDVSGGARVARNNQNFQQLASGILVAPGPLTKSSDTVTTYSANARYKLDRNNTAYLRFATGYRPGGPNYIALDPVTGARLSDPTFASDTLNSYEAGFKGQTRDRTFSYELSGYRIDWKDIQLSTVRGATAVIANAGRARIDGAEMTLTARPSSDVTVGGAFAYQNARLRDANTALGGKAGERLPNVPRFTAAVQTDFRASGPDLHPSLGATLRFISDRNASYSGNVGIPQYNLPSYVSVDLRAGVQAGPVALQAYVHNLFDEAGQLSAQTLYSRFGGAVKTSLIRPRTFGLSATSRF